MPDGRVEWFDARSGEGRISHLSQEYPADAGDMEPSARVAGARVHFDVVREDGVERAANVQLIEGTRTSKRQRRFGDLVGARHPSDKGRDQRQPYRRPPQPELTGDPRRVVEAWVDALAAGDVDGAVELYAPDASWHEGSQHVAGQRAIRRQLQESALAGARRSGVDIAGTGDDRFTVTWRPMAGDAAALVSMLRISRGEIVEQWIEEAS